MPSKAPKLPLLFKSGKLDVGELSAARGLINRVHYQNGPAHGEFILAYADRKDVQKLNPKFQPKWSEGDQWLVGVAVVKSGIAHGKPKGRRDLADKKFPGLKFDHLDRGELVQRMGLALISRVAVEPELQRMGIGCSLVRECRKQASNLVSGSKYVEVMTSQSLQNAKRLLTTEGAKRDFLQAAGFRLVPIFTKNWKAKERGRDRRLYYWAPIS